MCPCHALKRCLPSDRSPIKPFLCFVLRERESEKEAFHRIAATRRGTGERSSIRHALLVPKHPSHVAAVGRSDQCDQAVHGESMVNGYIRDTVGSNTELELSLMPKKPFLPRPVIARRRRLSRTTRTMRRETIEFRPCTTVRTWKIRSIPADESGLVPTCLLGTEKGPTFDVGHLPFLPGISAIFAWLGFSYGGRASGLLCHRVSCGLLLRSLWPLTLHAALSPRRPCGTCIYTPRCWRLFTH
jgi:hypothetical protein